MSRSKKNEGILLKTVVVCFLLICVLYGLDCNVQAAYINEWEKEWQDLCEKMELEAATVLKNEIAFGNEDMSDEDKSTALKSYYLSNAIPMWTLSSEFTMFSDYHKNNNDFSELIKWDDRWYIPAITMTGGHASILLQKEDDGYHIYGQYFDDDDNYIADNVNEIKDKIKKELPNVKIDSIRNISIPFYKINLIYIRQADGKDKVIPYQAYGATTLNDINEKSGKVYSVSQFISDMENIYEEYTEQELEQIIKKNKTEMSLGGSLQPKKKISVEISKEKNSFTEYYICIVIVILMVGFVGVRFCYKKRMGE